MKRSFPFIITLFLCSIQIHGINDYEKVLTERNLLYQQFQESLNSDTVTPYRKLIILQELISADNQILDDWIPELLKEIDSLNTIISTERKKSFNEINLLLEHRNILFYSCIGLAAFLLFFIILLIVSAIRRKKLKKQLQKALQAERDRDAYKSALDDKILELLSFKSHNAELQNKINRLEAECGQKLSDADKIMLDANQEIQNFQKVNQELISGNESLKFQTEQLNQKFSALHSDNEANIKLLQDEKSRVEELQILIGTEREESIKKLKEQEILLDEMRREIHELKSSLDEKTREELHEHFSQVSDVYDENNRLKKVIDEQVEIIEEYRKTLEQELDARKEFEIILKDLLKK